MNKQEILTALKRLATDLSELHSGDVLKLDTYSLLDHAMDEPGGVLVRWFNGESDQRTKALLRAAIRIVVKAGVKQENVQANGVELLRLVERLESKPAIPESGDAFEIHCKLNPTTDDYTHRDRAGAFKLNHPEDKRTIDQLRRKSEEYNSKRYNSKRKSR